MNEIAIKVEGVSKTFKLPHEKQNSIKSMFVNIFSGKKTYEKQEALKNISFEVKKGEFFGIVGRNGSGKSTLLKLLAGIYSPNKGHIQVNGKLTPFIELGVGFNHELSGRENVFLNGALLGFNRKEVEAMYEEIVNFAELKEFMGQKLKNYSSGMQVRLAFSIAIRAQSDILLLDEVLAVGDAAFQQKCYTHFEALRRQNRTVVFVTHDMGAVRRFCNRALYIKKGKVTHQGTPADIADVYVQDNIQDVQEVMPPEASLEETSSQKVRKEIKPVLSRIHSISSTISELADNKVIFTSSYKSKDKEEMYIGLGIIRDGLSIAEITTPLESPLIGDGKVAYTLDTRILNPGVYYIGASLFKLKNRELVAKDKIYRKFILKGEDITRGAALKLEKNWTNV